MNPEVTGVGRAACALVGMGGFTAGVFGTFNTDNEIGTSALLLIGGVSSLIALLGRVPRIKVGDNEIDPSVLAVAYAAGADEVAVEVAEAALEEKTPSEIASVARRAADSSRPGVSIKRSIIKLPDGRRLLAVAQDNPGHRGGGPKIDYFTPNGRYVGSRPVEGKSRMEWDEEFLSSWTSSHSPQPSLDE